MYQDIDPKAPNYHAFASQIVFDADKKMMQEFVLTLRERQAAREIHLPIGNGGSR